MYVCNNNTDSITTTGYIQQVSHAGNYLKVKMAATTHLVLWMMFVVTVIPLTNGLPVDLIVDTTQGKLQGFELDESYAFWGIPFAQPPVGNLRLRDPQPPVSWEDVRNATEHSDGCMQRCHEPPPACPVNVSTFMCNRTSKLPPLNRKRLSRYSQLVFILLNSKPGMVCSIWFHQYILRGKWRNFDVQFFVTIYKKGKLIEARMNGSTINVIYCIEMHRYRRDHFDCSVFSYTLRTSSCLKTSLGRRLFLIDIYDNVLVRIRMKITNICLYVTKLKRKRCLRNFILPVLGNLQKQ